MCLVTKAVHFDLSSSLSTEDFIATLERFVARRGAPAVLLTNNGSNFLGGREEIQQLQKLTGSSKSREAIAQFATKYQIDWKTIPPRSQHFGGLWEAAVKAMKLQLKKNIQPHALRWEELYSILTEAEAILNSRPLAPLHANEASEGNFLTAGHFLIGRPLRALPSKLPSTSPTSHLRR